MMNGWAKAEISHSARAVAKRGASRLNRNNVIEPLILNNAIRSRQFNSNGSFCQIERRGEVFSAVRKLGMVASRVQRKKCL